MKALHLALSFLLIPRLFASLILFPLLLSLLLVSGQVLMTHVLLSRLTKDPPPVDSSAIEAQPSSIVRLILFGSSEPLPAIRVCRWVKNALATGESIEAPPSQSCAPDRLDAALLVAVPESFNTGPYERVLAGSFERLHVCQKSCAPDVVISPEQTPARADVRSFWGWALLHEARLGVTARKDFIEKLEEIRSAQELIGNQHLFINGMRGAVDLKSLMYSVAVLLNLVLLVIVALWLALRAHRKVLDYFSSSGALLPLVAATGKGDFYLALWMLTMLRVTAFLAAAGPVTAIGIAGAIPDDTAPLFGGIDPPEILLWLIALSISFGCATLIASIAELKQRTAVLSFLYKFIPLLLSSAGALIWIFTFVMYGDTAETIRDFVTALPLVGMGPILVAPILKPKLSVIVVHTLLTTIFLLAAARRNARWFAAHVEDI